MTAPPTAPKTDLDRWRQIAVKHLGLEPYLYELDGVLAAIAEAVAEERERCIQAVRSNKPMTLAEFRGSTLMLQSWCMDSGKELLDGYADYLAYECVLAQRRAQRLGFGGLEVLNIFALRSTNPAALYTHPAPCGPANDIYIFSVCKKAGMVIAAWGVHGLLYRRAEGLRTALAYKEITLHHLGLTKEGAPRHPLYVSYSVQPEVWA